MRRYHAFIPCSRFLFWLLGRSCILHVALPVMFGALFIFYFYFVVFFLYGFAAICCASFCAYASYPLGVMFDVYLSLVFWPFVCVYVRCVSARPGCFPVRLDTHTHTHTHTHTPSPVLSVCPRLYRLGLHWMFGSGAPNLVLVGSRSVALCFGSFFFL